VLLADLGAEVTKLEPPEGDISRQVSDSYFASVNRGTRSIRLDLNGAAGQRELHELVAGALAADTADNWEKRLRRAGVPAAAVRDLASALAGADELLAEAGGYRLVGNPVRIDGYRPAYAGPPRLGEHGDLDDQRRVHRIRPGAVRRRPGAGREPGRRAGGGLEAGDDGRGARARALDARFHRPPWQDGPVAGRAGRGERRRGGAAAAAAAAGGAVPGAVPAELAWAHVQTEMLYAHVRRRLSEQLDGVAHGPDGSLDKLLMTWTEQAVGHAALAVAGPGDAAALETYLYSRAQSVMGGTAQIQKNIIAARILGLG